MSSLLVSSGHSGCLESSMSGFAGEFRDSGPGIVYYWVELTGRRMSTMASPP